MANAVPHDLSLGDYVALLRRRKWIVIIAIVVAPVCAYAFASQQTPVYQATASVATTENSPAVTIAGVQGTQQAASPAFAATQIILAETRSVARAVLARARVTSVSPEQLLNMTSITANPDADILYFTINGSDQTQSVTLANAYAEQYTVFLDNMDSQAYAQARSALLKRVAELGGPGKTGSYSQSLATAAAELETTAELQNANAVIASPAYQGVQVSPRPKHDALFGLAVGLVLGLGFAFLRDSLDTRVRTAEDIGQRTGLSLLARIPEPPRAIRRANELVMLRQPASKEAEAFRVLRTNIEFAGLGHELNSVMITSAVEMEGKSTTVSNLAVAEARAGKRVVLVDLDLRRPRIDKFFNLSGLPGLTNVVLGHATLEQSTAHIAIEMVAGGEGSLDVIPCGPLPPNPGEFVSATALKDVLDTLTSQYDLVLIDSPPLLRVGDSLALAANVAGMLVVTRIPGMRRPVLNELGRVLGSSPAPVLGFILTGSQGATGYHEGYYYDYAQKDARSTPEYAA